MNPILGGTVCRREIDGWIVTWESAGPYRHWCTLDSHHRVRGIAVLTNPGSLQGAGDDLAGDTTLRILRRVGAAAGCNWMVLNLFDYAATTPADLHTNWAHRNPPQTVFEHLDVTAYSFVVYAYGDLRGAHAADCAARIAAIRQQLMPIAEIQAPRTRSGKPMHPMNWQRQRKLQEMAAAITRHLEGA